MGHQERGTMMSQEETGRDRKRQEETGRDTRKRHAETGRDRKLHLNPET